VQVCSVKDKGVSHKTATVFHPWDHKCICMDFELMKITSCGDIFHAAFRGGLIEALFARGLVFG